MTHYHLTITLTDDHYDIRMVDERPDEPALVLLDTRRTLTIYSDVDMTPHAYIAIGEFLCWYEAEFGKGA